MKTKICSNIAERQSISRPSLSASKSRVAVGLRLSALTMALYAIGPSWALDLRQSFDAAMGWDANLKASNAALQSSKSRQSMAESLWNPTISVGGTVSETSVRSQEFSNTFTVALKARKALYRPSLDLGVDQAALYTKELQASADSEQRNLAIKVSTAYLDILLAQDQLALNRALRNSLNQQLAAAQKSLLSGTGTIADAEEVQVRLDANLAEALQLQQNLEFTGKQLQSLTNQPAVELMPLQTVKLDAGLDYGLNMDATLHRAKERNLEIAISRARLESARLGINLAKSQMAPSIDAVGSLLRNSQDPSTGVPSAVSAATVGLEFNIPLSNGGYTDANVRQAGSAIAQSEALLMATELDVVLRTRKEVQNITEGAARIRATDRARQTAVRLLTTTRKAFDGGVRTRTDILNAEDRVQTTSRDLAAQRYEFLKAIVRLKALLGEDPASAIDDVNQYLKP